MRPAGTADTVYGTTKRSLRESEWNPFCHREKRYSGWKVKVGLDIKTAYSWISVFSQHIWYMMRKNKLQDIQARLQISGHKIMCMGGV